MNHGSDPGSAPSDAFDVAVVGAGVIGVATAWQLARRGARVALFEREAIGAGASLHNAGQVRTSECTPLAAPGALRDAARVMFKRHAPVRILGTPTRSSIRWLWSFARATRAPLGPRRQALAGLGHLSDDLFDDFVRDHADLARGESLGALDVYETATGLASARAEASVTRAHGFACELIDREAVRSLEPMLSEHVTGALFFPNDTYVDPQAFLTTLAKEGDRAGVELVAGHPVERIVVSHGRADALVVNQEVVKARAIVLACGCATGQLARPVGFKLPIAPGKGYTVDVLGSSPLQRPVVFVERHAAATPLTGRIRLAAGMIVGSQSGHVPRGATAALQRRVRELLPSLDGRPASAPWAGLRPLTPDGLPVIGRFAHVPNLFAATGHGMLGVSYSLGTAALIADLCVSRRGEIDPLPFSPDRFEHVHTG